MRIGTWNLAGRWSAGHAVALAAMDCDVFLLTEVHVGLRLEGYADYRTSEPMGASKDWAAVLTRRPSMRAESPHPATAACRVEGLTFFASVLPWPLARENWPWAPSGHASRMETTAEAIGTGIDGATVWGGDWNQPLTGNIAGFSRAAQTILLKSVATHSLQVPTLNLSAQNGQASIDHIAVPESWTVRSAARVQAAELSDHDAYWVDVRPADLGDRGFIHPLIAS